MQCCSKKKKLPGFKETSLYLLFHKFRFSSEELTQHQQRFERMSENGTVSMEAFMNHMGMLGLSSNKFISNRIFKSMNTSGTGLATFEEYLEYMDILIHGTEDQKAKQSYNLIKKKNTEVISKDDFKFWLIGVLKLYSSLTGLEVNSSNDALEQYFEMIDRKKDGVIDFDEYKTTMHEKKEIFHWFDYITEGFVKKFEPVEVIEQPDYIKRLESVEEQLRKCMQMISSNNMGPKTISFPEQHHDGDVSVSYISEIDIESIVSIGNENLEESEVLPDCIRWSQRFSDRREANSDIFSLLKQLEEKVSFIKTGLQKDKSINSRFNIPKPQANKKSLIQWGDEDWNLILNMMLGIQKSILVCNQDLHNYPQPEEFQKTYKHNLLPSHGTYRRDICQFKDYYPSVFLRIRKFYKISNEAYLNSLGVVKLMHSLFKGEFSSLVGLISAGKSGCFFYYSDDGQYMLKTMTRKEYLFFKTLLPEYYNHVANNPNTLMLRYFGFHKIIYKKGSNLIKQHFVVMGNVFKSGLEIHSRYDLKGSTHGRSTNESEDYSIPRKDIDFNLSGTKINVGSEIKEALLKQIELDCEFLSNNNINDYSLLLGIHYLKNDLEIPIDEGVPLYERNLGGILSEDKKMIYFIGIIDILTVFNFTKRLEFMVKTQLYGNSVSCVPPIQYAERFSQYMESIII